MRVCLAVGPVAFCVAGCVADDGDDEAELRELPLTPEQPVFAVGAPLPGAYCDIQVTGVGNVAMEEDYLPHVIQCENGGANLEALKAQAIAARSVAYYSIATSGSICDGQGCQVYSCGSNPLPVHYQAVQETSGVYLNYNNTLTYGFFVAGDSSVGSPSCVGVDGNASTEHWVTYNEGRSGTDVEQTELGYVFNPGDSGYGQNRGCMGQWAARCLENDNGYDSTAILQFFYGDDIVLTQASGECVVPLPGSSDTGAVDSSGGAMDSSGGAVDSSSDGGVTTAPMTTTTTAGGEGGSQSGGESSGVSGDVSASDGTGAGDADGGDALPDTFGENTDAPQGCACGLGDGEPPSWWLLAALPWLGRRRRPR
ncbi:MAG: SpoIID/LytB domain-containing protein [Deltaproteobacteria bacterium]|nr:SpoIID/LytB domain-containing protein [Deltaproteobacteria bacterium]